MMLVPKLTYISKKELIQNIGVLVPEAIIEQKLSSCREKNSVFCDISCVVNKLSLLYRNYKQKASKTSTFYYFLVTFT